MTQGNCGRMAVGTRPDSAARGRTRPPPRPPPPPRRCPPPRRAALPALPPLPPQPAAGAFGGSASRRTGGARGGGWGAGEGPRARGGRRGAPAGIAGRAAPRPLPSPPPGRPGTAARLPWELCSFPSNYLSEQRAGGGPLSWRVSPSASEGRSGWRGGSARVSSPPALPPFLPLPFPLLLPLLSDTTQPWLFLPLPLGSLQCGRTASTVSCPPANSGRRSGAAPAALGAPRARGSQCLLLSRSGRTGLCDRPPGDLGVPTPPPRRGAAGASRRLESALRGASLGSRSCSHPVR